MKKLVLILTMFSLSFNTIAQANEYSESGELTDDQLNQTFNQEEVEEISNLRQGSVIKQRDMRNGLFMDDYNTYRDKNRISLLFHVNNDLSALTDLQTVEFNWAKKFELAWLEFFLLRTSGKFKEFTENNPNEGGSSEDLQESSDQVLAIGGSITYRGTWIKELIESDKIFTSTSAGLGWYRFSQSFRNFEYSGPGLKCDFGIHRRTSRSLHYGLKMSYQLAHTKRAQEFEGESSSARSQLLSWLSFGFDLSFYF